ncbi:MAG: signal peptidase I [Clostridiales bacterium]|nr:signal peptidase I [Clostridiales bacterium]
MKPVLSDSISEAVVIRRKQSEKKRLIRQLIMELAVSFAVIMLAGTFLFGVTVQHGNDMYPAIKDGDLILFFRVGELLPTEAVVYEWNGTLHTGRLEGAPGYRISETADHRLTVNDRFLPPDPDRGITEETYTAEGEELPVSLGDDCWFILNDNRTRTADSREFGVVDRDRIRGRIVTVLRRRSI